MFNLAIDSKLRGCDVVAMKVEDVRHLVDAAFEHADVAAGGCSGRKRPADHAYRVIVAREKMRPLTGKLRGRAHGGGYCSAWS
jgi:hypothetical protein